jgi:hypothetical protein
LTVWSAGTVLLLVIVAEGLPPTPTPVPPCPEIACDLDVDLATPTPVPVDDWAHAGPLAAITTMAAQKSRFMCGSPRAGRMKIPQPSADGDTKKKKLFSLAHETQRVGELFNLFNLS